MLTPLFELSQTELEVVVNVKVPYAKVSETDIFFEDYQFTFYCKPYYLRLALPGKVCYSEEPKVTYDVEIGSFTIHMIKATPGEHFEDLDFITKFLVSKGTSGCAPPKIEVIGGEESSDCEDLNELDWELYQNLQEEELIIGDGKCGFANKYCCSVFRLKDEASTIFDIVDAHSKLQSVRCTERLEDEAKKFSDDHYLADLYDGEAIKEFIDFKAEWDTLFSQLQKQGNVEIEYTTEEKDRLVHFPNKEFILDSAEVKSLYLSLVDIIFAFAYNKRTTLAENTVESGWTINKLSATLCWLDTFSSLQQVAQSAVRRSLIFPLYRNWELSMKVFQDTRKILKLGRKYVLKCFLEIYSIMCVCDPRYILNDLFISDYCIWIQRYCSSKALQKFVESLEKITVNKGDVNLDIEELEVAAKLVQQESTNQSVDSLCSNIANLTVDNTSKNNKSESLENDSDDDDDDDDTSSYTTTDSDDYVSE